MRLLSTLILALGVLEPHIAVAGIGASAPKYQSIATPLVCDEEDQKSGPNCVQESETERFVVYSVVYRRVGNEKQVVWEGVGQVRESTEGYLVVHTLVITEEGNQWADAKFPWVDTKNHYSYTAE